ncbi:hypothetical protein [Bosea sp. 685]|uniref:hypothetical protein n=1 Tax=Bosea sp. 685 TaxID=3080057 RepID=UPI0028934FDC|nr:hypothetical protein [Bosea sp. 685]WNJ91325.1 hypothetical protein RMR04_03190 [Bosea sp. 685]
MLAQKFAASEVPEAAAGGVVLGVCACEASGMPADARMATDSNGPPRDFLSSITSNSLE